MFEKLTGILRQQIFVHYARVFGEPIFYPGFYYLYDKGKDTGILLPNQVFGNAAPSTVNPEKFLNKLVEVKYYETGIPGIIESKVTTTIMELDPQVILPRHSEGLLEPVQVDGKIEEQGDDAVIIRENSGRVYEVNLTTHPAQKLREDKFRLITQGNPGDIVKLSGYGKIREDNLTLQVLWITELDFQPLGKEGE